MHHSRNNSGQHRGGGREGGYNNGPRQNDGGGYNRGGYRNSQQHHNNRPTGVGRHPTDVKSYKLYIHDNFKLRDAVLPHIYTVEIDKLSIDSDFGSIFTTNPQILTLRLRRLSFRQNEVPKDLLNFIKNSESLEELDLDDLEVTLEQQNSLFEAVKQSKQLASLLISGYTGPSSALVDIIKGTHLDDIVLKYSQIEDFGSFIDVLLTSQISALTLRQVPLSLQNIETLCTAIRKGDCHLQKLVTDDNNADLEGNQISTSFAQSIVSQAFIHNSNNKLYKNPNASLNENIYGKIEEKDQCTEVNNMPAHVAAIINNKHAKNNDEKEKNSAENSSSYDWDTDKSCVVVTHWPKQIAEQSDKDYVNHWLIPAITRAFFNVLPNGHFVIIGPKNRRSCSRHLVQRMNALFEAKQVGFVNTCRSFQDSSNNPSSHHTDSSTLKPTEEDDFFNLLEFNILIFKKQKPCLRTEYGRFLQSKLMVDSFFTTINVDRNYNSSKEIPQVLEQWFMLRANGEDADEYPYKALVEEKKMCGGRETDDWVHLINQLVLEIPRTPKNIALTTESIQFIPPRGRDNRSNNSPVSIVEYKYGAFCDSLQSSRGDALLEQARKRHYDDPMIPLTTMLLRYASVFGNFRQFCCSFELFQKIVDSNFAELEGFASPFNAQILICKPPPLKAGLTWTPTFCSCYEDTDSPFGSLGSFFHQTLRGKHSMVNPPTVETVLTETVHYLHLQLDRYPCSFTLLLPAWDDLVSQAEATKSKYLLKKDHLDSSVYPSQNPYTGESHPSKKKFDLFLLTKE